MDNSGDLVERGKALYGQAVNQVLGGYQLIEEMLKTYIGLHFDITRTLVKGRLHFDFKREDHQDSALGRLVQVFSRLCANKDLVAELRSVVGHRDQIAHRALLKLYEPDLTPPEYAQLLGEMQSNMKRISHLMGKIRDETGNLRVD